MLSKGFIHGLLHYRSNVTPRNDTADLLSVLTTINPEQNNDIYLLQT